MPSIIAAVKESKSFSICGRPARMAGFMLWTIVGTICLNRSAARSVVISSFAAAIVSGSGAFCASARPQQIRLRATKAAHKNFSIRVSLGPQPQNGGLELGDFQSNRRPARA
jgi:hypothetical protein